MKDELTRFLEEVTSTIRDLSRRVRRLEKSQGGGGNVLDADTLDGHHWSEIASQLTEGPGIDIAASSIGLGGDSILIYKPDGTPVTEYAGTDAGLEAARVAAVSGDVIVLPNYAFTLTFTLAPGVKLVSPGNTRLTGTVTLSADSVVEGIFFDLDANSVSPVTSILGPNSGTAWVKHCHFQTVNTSSGEARCVTLFGNGDLYCIDCFLDGRNTGGGGVGYAAHRNPISLGSIYIEGGTALGSNPTSPFNE